MKQLLNDLNNGYILIEEDLSKIVYMNEFAKFTERFWLKDTNTQGNILFTRPNTNLVITESKGEQTQQMPSQEKDEHQKWITDELLNYIFAGSIPTDLEEVYNTSSFKQLCIKHIKINIKQSIQLQYLMRFNNDTKNIEVIFNEVSEISKYEQRKAEKWLRSVYIEKIVNNLIEPLESNSHSLKVLSSMLKNEEEISLNKNKIMKGCKILNVNSIYFNTLIEDMSDKIKIDNIDNFAIQKSKFNLKETTLQCSKMFQLQVLQKRKDITIKTQIDEELPQMIFSDLKRFKQLLFNFIENAINNTTKGGIFIKIKKYMLKGLGLVSNKEMIQVVITDTGKG